MCARHSKLTNYSGPDPAEVENAKNMCISLLDSVKASYAEFKERPPRGGGGYGGGYGGEERGGYGGGRGGRDRDYELERVVETIVKQSEILIAQQLGDQR